jgi:hypothetical protein
MLTMPHDRIEWFQNWCIQLALGLFTDKDFHDGQITHLFVFVARDLTCAIAEHSTRNELFDKNIAESTTIDVSNSTLIMHINTIQRLLDEDLPLLLENPIGQPWWSN